MRAPCGATSWARVVSLGVALSLLAAGGCRAPRQRTFSSPEDAVRALTEAAKAGTTQGLIAIFGPDSKDLVDANDPTTERRNREVFTAAVAERWHLVDQGNDSKVLVIGNEDWPFPVPLTKDASGWRFDTPAGREEVLDRRIGHNELAAIRICGTYVEAQRLYAQHGHDGQPPGRYARTIQSDPGRQNGLYWPAAAGQKRSPLGDLVAQAAEEGRPVGKDARHASPFHGYYFRILTAQGPAAPGGATDYVTNGRMAGGFAMVAWPAQYGSSGIMTFIVSAEGIVREKDLGTDTASAAQAMTAYNPDASWTAAQ
jgi:hypothetical protein